MLLDFTLENWMSFRDPVTFTMMPVEEIQYDYVLPQLEDELKVLPVAAIFGGNASGKSNFVKSLKFAREFIVRGICPDEQIPVNTFKLEKEYESSPTKLRFVVAIEGKRYLYEFATTTESVIFEAMHELNGKRKSLLYKIDNGKIKVGSRLQFKTETKNVFKHKRTDQLLLTTISHLTSIRLPVYSWFLDLIVIQPQDNAYSNSLMTDSKFRQHVNEILKTLDCGIISIDLERNGLRKIKPNGGKPRSNLFDLPEEANRPRFVTYHKNSNGILKKFELREESEGTKRLIDLIAVFVKLSASGAKELFVIDSIERSLHTQLLCTLVNAYLTNCDSQTRTQIIFTTHDVQLMDETEFFRDEVWLTERNEYGVSDLFSLGDFEYFSEVQSVRNSYLVGRYGGKPRLSLMSNHLRMP